LGIALLAGVKPIFSQTINPGYQPDYSQPATPLAPADINNLPPVAASPATTIPNSGAVAQAPVPATPGNCPTCPVCQQFSLATTPNMIGDLPGGDDVYFDGRLPRAVNVGNLPIAGNDRRAKISEDSSPIPTDRVFLDFNHFDSAAETVDGHIIDMDRYTFGLEKTFFNGSCSIEVRAPIVRGLGSNETDPVSVDGNEGTVLGNVSITPKYLFVKSDTWASSVGFTVNLPTAPNVSDTEIGYETTRVRNESVYLEPFLGLLLAPNNRIFSISYIQFDFDANGSPVTSQYFSGPIEADGRFRDSALMHVDISAGYWLFDRREEFRASSGLGGWISGIAPIVELHYTTSLQSFSQHVAAITSDFAREDVLDLTGGLDFLLGPLSNLTVAAAAPLRTSPRDRAFDAEVIVQFDQHF